MFLIHIATPSQYNLWLNFTIIIISEFWNFRILKLQVLFLSLYDLLDNITCEEVWIYVILFQGFRCTDRWIYCCSRSYSCCWSFNSRYWKSAVVFGDSLESIYLVSDCVEPEENKSNHCLRKKLEHCFISENLQTQFIYAVTMV